MKVSKIPLDDYSVAELKELQERIEGRVESLVENELAELDARRAQLAELVGKKRTGGRGRARGKVEPKYQDPKSGKTWSGRGMTPVWLRELEAQGKSREQYAL